jgi:cell division protein FtsL
MSLFRKTKTAEQQQAKSSSEQGQTVVNYTWIIRHFGFFMFLALLAVIYIANVHWADKTIRDINITQKQVKDMEYEYKNLKSLEMYRSRESQVTQAAAAMGLKPSSEPPVKLEAETKN